MSGFVSLTRAEILDSLIRMALAEDVGPGDWTTLWTVDEDRVGTARIVAKQELVVAGTHAAARVFESVEPAIDVEIRETDASRVGPGAIVMEIEGPLRAILTAERTALNFLGRLSGIATLTSKFTAAVRGTRARVIDTRKTTPGFRYLEKDAVLAGGGSNHRIGLHDMVLIKENHIAAAGGLREAIRRVARFNDAGLVVEVEVRDLSELRDALAMAPDRVLLDNMSLADMRAAMHIVEEIGTQRPEVEASGNVDLDSVRRIAETGVDLISVGALTHSAPMADVSLRVPSLEPS